MLLCIDVGNSQIHSGVYDGDVLIDQFRYSSTSTISSDQLGIFIKNALREIKVFPEQITQIAISSVVPEINYSLRSACQKYFKINPLFLVFQNQNILSIRSGNPDEIGPDRLASGIGARSLFPNQNIFIVDFGTATTVCIVTKEGEYRGGAIMPGVKTCAKALNLYTAKLPTVEVVIPKMDLEMSTVSNIQTGLFWGQIGGVEKLVNEFKNKFFKNEEVLVIATGGFSSLFAQSSLFSHIISDLVLTGLRQFTNQIHHIQ